MIRRLAAIGSLVALFVLAAAPAAAQEPIRVGFLTCLTGAPGLFLKQALEKAGGRIEESDTFLKALRAVALTDAPGGPIHLDKYGNPVHNVYIRRVERKDGRLQNTVLHTIENVSQFWTYPEAEFLKAPPYSRNHPPCRYC